MIWVTQWLCPSRHCSIAFAWDDKDEKYEDIEKRGEVLYATGTINRYCGICRGDLHVEHGRTRFKTLAEAMPDLKRSEAENAMGQAILGRY